MANQLVRDLITELPWAMRESVAGYVDAVAAAARDIEKDAGVKLPPEKADLFLFTVAIRRVWATINSQYWIMHDSVSIAKSRDLEGFKVGRDTYASGSDALAESLELRVGFEKLIMTLGIEHLVKAGKLADVLRGVIAEV